MSPVIAVDTEKNIHQLAIHIFMRGRSRGDRDEDMKRVVWLCTSEFKFFNPIPPHMLTTTNTTTLPVRQNSCLHTCGLNYLNEKLFSSRLRHSETLIEFCIPRHFARLFLLLVIDPDWQLSFFLVSSHLAASLLAYENDCVLVLALQPYAWEWPEHKTQLYVECGYTPTGYPAFPHDET